jgi:hypothetical protein
MNRRTSLILILKPHVESDGTHRERFEAYLGDELIRISRQPLSDGARTLITRGHDPAELLTIQHHDRAYASFAPAPIGELARWTYSEEVRGRIRRVPWAPFEMAPRRRAVESPAAEGRVAGVILPDPPSARPTARS